MLLFVRYFVVVSVAGKMWNALYEWRTQTKLLHLVHQAGVYHSEGKRVPDSVRRMSTMSTMSTATSSMGSNGSIGPPEVCMHRVIPFPHGCSCSRGCVLV